MSLKDTVCATCGVIVAQARDGRWLHADELDEDQAEHDVDTVIARGDYLFGQQEKVDAQRAPTELALMIQERQAVALERIAGAVERIALRLDT